MRVDTIDKENRKNWTGSHRVFSRDDEREERKQLLEEEWDWFLRTSGRIRPSDCRPFVATGQHVP